MSTEHVSYVGHEVIDDDLNTVGVITDVLYDDGENEPKWLVVKPGLLQSERFVPIEGSYESAAGNVVVPFDKQWVKAAPKASGDHVLTADIEHEAAAHYDLHDA